MYSIVVYESSRTAESYLLWLYAVLRRYYTTRIGNYAFSFKRSLLYYTAVLALYLALRADKSDPIYTYSCTTTNLQRLSAECDTH